MLTIGVECFCAASFSGLVALLKTRARRRVKRLYHITKAGDKIEATGEMLRGKDGYAGGGIYFAESVEEARKKAKSKGYIITADVIVGRAKVITRPEKHTWTQLKKRGFDSVEIRGLRTGTEYVVYNRDQVTNICIEKEDSFCLVM
mmetsp:Transcript_29166/g.44054  ORF Transcript_29166/g.44054 Transcript_29166/m.44054 type:complete len:146 (+) Transcript_29166:80-517(+)